MNLEQLRAALQKAMNAVKEYPGTIKADDGSNRRMTKDELEKYKGLMEEVESLKSEIDLAERAAAQAADVARTAPADQQTRTLPAAPKGDEEKKPFKSFGEQLSAIASATMKGDVTGQSDRRLVYGKAAGANETIASEGGFLVQEDFSLRLMGLMHETGEIMRRVTNIPISSNANALKMPTIDETSRARGSRWGGVRAYWLAEGEQKIDSKPKFGTLSLALNKIAALGYATDELLQDATALEAIMLQAFAEEIRFEVEDSIINGNGAGKPLGILKSGAVITIAKTSGQTDGTITFENLMAMMNALPTRSRRNAVWLVSDSGTESALHSITLPGGGGYPIFLPPGQSNTPGNTVFGTLLGRPVIPVEYLPALGAAGDIMLVDLSEYITIDKGGMQSAESMHVRFIYDETTFRLVYRIDGKPAWRQPITTANGAMSKSPFVALGARVT